MKCFRTAAAWTIAALLAGCSDPMLKAMTGRKLHECNGFDMPLARLATHSRKELRARIVAAKLDQDFPFVVETTADSLVIVGFTPLGTKAFTLVRHGDVVDVDNHSGPALAIPPRNLMEDVLAMSMPSRCAALGDPVTVTVTGDWQISDTCVRGSPIERRIAHPGAPAEIEITYAKNAILVKQNRCHYGARYVLQATALPVTGEDVGDEDGR
jgi:hypothetical protein